jgi:hypothetical protein
VRLDQDGKRRAHARACLRELIVQKIRGPVIQCVRTRYISKLARTSATLGRCK